MGNAQSLTCHIKDGEIKYNAWKGHGSSGMGLCENNVCPMHKKYFPVDNPDGLSVAEFADNIIKMWDQWKDVEHGPKIERVVESNVTFCE